MQVVIIGAAGMLGKKLTKALLKRGTLAGADGQQQKIEKLTLVDNVTAPDIPQDSRATFVQGEVFDPALIKKLIAPGTASVFQFAAVVSAGAEADFDLGYRVNLEGMRNTLEACRALGSC